MKSLSRENQADIIETFICYKYNKPIRSIIFNFNKLVSDLDIDTSTPDT